MNYITSTVDLQGQTCTINYCLPFLKNFKVSNQVTYSESNPLSLINLNKTVNKINLNCLVQGVSYHLKCSYKVLVVLSTKL